MLYNRTLLFIHPIYNSLHLLPQTPNPSLPHPEWNIPFEKSSRHTEKSWNGWENLITVKSVWCKAWHRACVQYVFSIIITIHGKWRDRKKSNKGPRWRDTTLRADIGEGGSGELEGEGTDGWGRGEREPQGKRDAPPSTWSPN